MEPIIKIFEWIKNHVFFFVLIIILVFISLIFIVHIPYWLGSAFPKYAIVSDYKASDILNFLGSFIAFIGTILLGSLALWQNQRFKSESDKKDNYMLFLENEKIRLQYLPSFLAQSANVQEWSIGIDSSTGINIYAMNKEKSYIFIINNEGLRWLNRDKFPCVPECRINEVVEIINCGNNTAHQVKVIMQLGEKRYQCDKSYSIRKDDKIYLFVSHDNKLNINERISLVLRYFDTFQNVYEQVFDIRDEQGCIEFKSYSDVQLIYRSKQMQIIA